LVGKRRHVDFVKAIVDIAGVTLLLQQDSVSRRGEEDLLAEHVGNIRKQGDSGEHNEADPRLTRCDYVEVLAVELSLDLRGHEVDVEDDHTAVVQQEANCTRSHTQPVPEHCLEEQFVDDDVDDEGEGDRGGEPMLVSQSTAVNRSSQSLQSLINVKSRRMQIVNLRRLFRSNSKRHAKWRRKSSARRS